MSAELSTPVRIDNLLLPGDVPGNDLSALRAVANWIRTFVTRPHKDLGRAGPVCPFLPRALERHTVWLATERVTDRSVTDVVATLIGYRDLLLRAQPVEGA